jgi:apolipoprotein N-acyltransferase
MRALVNRTGAGPMRGSRVGWGREANVRLMRRLAQVIGWALVSVGMLLGAATLASLVDSHVLFVEARLLVLSLAGAIEVVGLVLVLLARKKAAG